MTQTRLLFPVLFALAVVFSGCSSQSEKKAAENERKAPEQAAPKQEAPAPRPDQVFKVKFDTTKGPFIVEVHRDWAPVGAERFEQLVKDGYFNGARFFRAIPDFVVQWGIAGDPKMTKKWDKPIKDDPVTHTNRLGSIVFATAGPNTRTTQVFVNVRSNQNLDSEGFAPFGEVTEGIEVVQKIYTGYGDEPDQEQITKRGNAYLSAKFPKLDYIRKAAIM